jgi:ATP-dependent Clp protease adaptor protein ClpS
LLNDDYTPMEFVVYVLERFFNKSREDATRIMLHVHQNGVGRVRRLHLRSGRDKGRTGHRQRARHQHPLQCTMEKE